MLPRRRDRYQQIERDTSMHSHQLAMEIHKERQREIERRLRLGSAARKQIRHRSSLRRRVGRVLIQLGSALAADGPTALAARR
jgi:hypothetical protein